MPDELWGNDGVGDDPPGIYRWAHYGRRPAPRKGPSRRQTPTRTTQRRTAEGLVQLVLSAPGRTPGARPKP